MKNEKFLWYSIYTICILFIVFFIVIQLNNRVNSQDDFILIKRLKELGFWKSIMSWKFNQRPVGHFFFNLTFYFNEKIESFRWSILISNLVFMILFTHSIKIIISHIFRIYNIILAKKKIWSISFLIVICAFFFVFERSELWFWYICFLIYLLPILLLNYGVILTISKTKKNWLSLIFFFLIGGELEIHIFITFVLLTMIYLNKLIPLFKYILNIISLSSLSILQLFNNGIENRINLEKTSKIIESSTFTSTFTHLIDQKNIFFILILFSILSVIPNTLKRINISKIITQTFPILILTFFATLSVGKIVFTNSWGPLRIWGPFSILLMFTLITLAISISIKIQNKIQIIGVVSSFLFIILFGVFSVKQYYMTSNYAKAYDQVIETNNNVKQNTESGILISPGHFDYLLEYINSSKK